MTNVKKWKDEDPPGCPEDEDEPQKQTLSQVDDEKRAQQQLNS